MKFGIKQKILLVLIGVLALTTGLAALFASYFTNRQNEQTAFAELERDLLTWQTICRPRRYDCEKWRSIRWATR